MAEYIEREALVDDLRGSYNDLMRICDKLHYPDEKEICKGQLATFLECILRVKDAPTASVVEVVRCKDCKYRMLSGTAPFMYYRCTIGNGLAASLKEDDFCSYGERRGT